MASIPQDAIVPTVSAAELTALQQAVADFDRDQLIWSSGYLVGLAGSTELRISPNSLRAVAPANTASSKNADQWHVFYASETGNSRNVAERLAANAAAVGLTVTVQDLRDIRPKALKNINNAVFVLATHGVGEPPEGSELFFEFWMSDKAPQLEHLNFSVLALGDSSYADFCEIGRAFDARLKALGATAVVDRTDCDLDFEIPSTIWTDQVVELASASATSIEVLQSPHLSAVPTSPTYTKQHPFSAEILSRQIITGRNSSKDVRHIELDLEDSGLVYQPGDSLGVVPTNPPQLVEALLLAIDFNGDEIVTIGGESISLANAFSQNKEITALSRPILDAVSATHPRLTSILADRDQFANFLATRQLIDLVQEYPLAWQPQQFIDVLRGLTPRLYSIASSLDANPDEAHLTVAVVDYEKFGRQHWGSASNFLIGGTAHAPIYVEPNEHFRLPTDSDTPIIMVGAGTGVAPYRAFVEHRREHGQLGKNWLVFGDRNLSSDFLYQLEWLRYRKDGSLSNLDVAFSRDQNTKVYVQHRLTEKGAQVYDWLEQGAHFYVCGDAEHMAIDVHNALLGIVKQHGDRSDDDAREYLNELKRTRRYQRDVY
ncbi:MAG: assimilatory sulfite reductase (NADPH) flavoprotein subunit [Proteobacteria bacterium]|nr:assimilatory sulfite reductase (NADPH) flavoprotein subunit [Pseudomonadota bacterium]